MSFVLLLEVIIELGCVGEGWGQKREVFLCKQLSACMCAVWKSGCVAPAVDCPLCHCSQEAVAKKNVIFAGLLMGIERMEPGPTDAKVHAVKITPTHIVFFFDLGKEWHLRCAVTVILACVN